MPMRWPPCRGVLISASADRAEAEGCADRGTIRRADREPSAPRAPPPQAPTYSNTSPYWVYMLYHRSSGSLADPCGIHLSSCLGLVCMAHRQRTSPRQARAAGASTRAKLVAIVLVPCSKVTGLVGPLTPSPHSPAGPGSRQTD
jgi:hypothetical protein